MITKILSAGDTRSLQLALKILQLGGLVAFPTDTVYGVGALAFNGTAVEEIYAAKGRPVDKGIPILIGDVEEFAKVSAEIPEIALKLALHFWPGPLTLVVPKHPQLPLAVSSTNSVGVRNPNHAIARSLLHLAGPMAVTSANLSGRPSPTTAEEVFADLGGRIALILDGGKSPGGIASTVVNCIGMEPQILRVGPVSMDEILALSNQSI